MPTVRDITVAPDPKESWLTTRITYFCDKGVSQHSTNGRERMAILSLEDIQPLIDPVALLETAPGGLPTGEWTRHQGGTLSARAAL
jgi:hypothetical protein